MEKHSKMPKAFNLLEFPAELRLSIYDELFESTLRKNWRGLYMVNKQIKDEMDTEFFHHLVKKLAIIQTQPWGVSLPVTVEFSMPTNPEEARKLILTIRIAILARENLPSQGSINCITAFMLGVYTESRDKEDSSPLGVEALTQKFQQLETFLLLHGLSLGRYYRLDPVGTTYQYSIAEEVWKWDRRHGNMAKGGPAGERIVKYLQSRMDFTRLVIVH
jgi:hypothetical protein